MSTNPDSTFVPTLDLSPEPASHPVAPAPKRPDIQREDPTTAQEREAAFDAIFSWNGKPLHPFSIERYCAFLSHRAAIGAPTLLAAIKDGCGFYPDAIRILWLCSSKPPEILTLRRDPERMEEAIQQWAETYAPPPQAMQIITTALDIWNSATTNQPEVRTHSSSASGRKADMGN